MPKPIAALLGLCLLLLAGAAGAADTFPVPDDARALMPADVVAVVAASSVDTVLDEIIALGTAFGAEEEMDREEMLAGLDDKLGRFREIVDMGRPIFLVSGLPNPMAGDQMPLTMILPRHGDLSDLADAEGDSNGFGKPIEHGSYFATSMDPAYAPAGELPDLVGHLPDGVISLSLDLETVVTNFRPFLDMGLAGIPTRPAGTPPDSTGAMTPEEAAAIADMARTMMDALTRLDLAFGRRGELVTMHAGYGIRPGSALDAGPQPDFAQALALTGAMPADADIRQAMAIDYSVVFEPFRDFYLNQLTASMAPLGRDKAVAYRKWAESYIDQIAIWSRPAASVLWVEDEGAAGLAVLETPEATAAADAIAALIEGLDALDMGYAFARLPDVKVAGTTFRTWDVAFDGEKFAGTIAEGADPDLAASAQLQAEQMMAMMRKIVPRIYLGVRDGYVLTAADDDSEALERLIGNLGHGQPDPALARLAAIAGPGCRQVLAGDIFSIMRWTTDMVAEMSGGEKIALEENPIPVEAYFTLTDSDWSVNAGIDLQSLSRLAQIMKAMTPDD